MQASSPAKSPRPSWPDPWRCTVEVLVVSGCPGTELSVARIRQATASLGIETNLRFVIVDDEAQAQSLGFKGSPTVRVEGIDVDDDADSRPVGLSCRLYPVEDEGDDDERSEDDASAGKSDPRARARAERSGASVVGAHEVRSHGRGTEGRAPPLAWIRAALARSAPLLDPR